MKIFWWQGGLHAEPQSGRERQALLVVSGALCRVDVNESVPGGPVLNLKNKQVLNPPTEASLFVFNMLRFGREIKLHRKRAAK